MSRSTSSELLLAAALLLALSTTSARAAAQACCAGSGVVTPARLALHEAALLGVQAKAGVMTGSYNADAEYRRSPAGTRELDFEQDLFAALRVLERGQLALYVPLIETYRKSRALSESGGGVGDVNLSARWDFTLAGASRTIPGIALLTGLTAPSGRPPDAPNLGALATGATGTGAWQISLGLAAEQSFGPWLVAGSAFVAQRTARTVRFGATSIHQRLAPQWTGLAALAYVLPNEAALAVSAAYTAEGNATIDGSDAPRTGHRSTTLALSALWPFGDSWRLQGSLFDNPPLSQLGKNQPADVGAQSAFVHSWL